MCDCVIKEINEIMCYLFMMIKSFIKIRKNYMNDIKYLDKLFSLLIYNLIINIYYYHVKYNEVHLLQ